MRCSDNGGQELGMKFDQGKPLCSEFSLNSAGGYKDVAGKLRWTLLPLESLTEVVKVLEYGANKYKEPGNWKKVEVERYHEALWRHWVAYNSGEKLDGKEDES